MDTKWSLYVKDFGKIKEAKIEISPMLIFVGDNSSGKSYMMTLLWGLITQSEVLVQDIDITQLKAYDKCSNWIKNLQPEGLASEEIQKYFVELFNEILAIKKNIFVQNIFNGGINIAELKIVDYKSEDIKYKCNGSEFSFFEKGTGSYNLDTKISNISLDELVKIQVLNLCQDFILKELVSDDSWGLNDWDALYFPAARTGFTLSYKTLLAGAVNTAFSNKSNEQRGKSSFSEPVVNFLKRWTHLGSLKSNNDTTDIVEYIEKTLIKGKLKNNDMPVSEVFFYPEGSTEELPMHMTSSLISEVAPIALFLKYEYGFKTIIIEEPEAHLQLKAQMVMARVLAKLLNKGFNIWITTHSDTLVQELNNLIKLNHSKNKEKFLQKHNMQQDECIDFNKVKVYEYRNNDNVSNVEATAGSETGYEYPQFADAIYNQTNKIIELESEEDDD